MKQNKKISALLCGLLLFSAFTFGADRNSNIQGRWTSVPPVFWYGNMFVYAFPVTELDFTGYGILFIKNGNGSDKTVSLRAYFYDGEELILSNACNNQLQYGKGTVSIETKVLNIRGFDDALLSNGTYYYLGESYM